MEKKTNINSGDQQVNSKGLLIRNGIITNDDTMYNGDVYIEGGVIVKIGTNLSVGKDVRVIEADGNYIIPGGIDPHTHFQFPFMGSVSIDDFYQGTKAALAGGTTMIMDYVVDREDTPLDAYHKWRGWADEKVCCDYGLHVAVVFWSEQVKSDMAILSREKGINSFKIFMAYKDNLMLKDDDIIKVFQQCKAVGGLGMVHAENGDIIEENSKRLFELGITGPEGHLYCRPEEVETEATHRAIVMANQMRCPLYVVHVMSKSSADIIIEKRKEGCEVFGEVLAAGLSLDGSPIFDTCWSRSAAHVMSPPLRTDPATAPYLMNLVAKGYIEVTASDNCSFTSSQKALLGATDFRKIPSGLNGVEDRMSVIWEKGVFSGILDPCKFVAVTSTNAAKIFNIYPKKGRIQVGSDADIVVWNAKKTRTISSKTHHQATDFNVFEGMVCHGVPVYVVCRGKVVVDNGQLNVTRGSGQFIPTPPFSPYVYSRLQIKDKITLPKKVDRPLHQNKDLTTQKIKK